MYLFLKEKLIFLGIWILVLYLSPDQPFATVSTMVLCLNLSSATCGSLFVFHFRSVWILTPTAATFRSLESLYCIVSLVCVTINSFFSPLKGSFMVLVLPYKSALLKHLGRPSHLLFIQGLWQLSLGNYRVAAATEFQAAPYVGTSMLYITWVALIS